jgi:hypothetical protein
MLKTDAAQTRPPSLTLSAGHRGATATGDRTLGVNIGLDNPLGLADRWGLSLKRSGEGRVIPDDGPPLSRSLTFSGNSKSLMLSVKRAIHRDQVLKTAVALRAKCKDAVNELLGTVIDVNSPILDTAELKLTRNRPVRDGNLDLSLSWRQGLRARESVLSSQSGGELTNTPYLRLAIDLMPLIEASANCGFDVGHLTGAGVEKLNAGDVNGAAADFAAAYDAGNAEGAFYSERLCEPGLGTDRDEMRAAYLYSAAAEKGGAAGRAGRRCGRGNGLAMFNMPVCLAGERPRTGLGLIPIQALPQCGEYPQRATVLIRWKPRSPLKRCLQRNRLRKPGPRPGSMLQVLRPPPSDLAKA